MPLEVTDMFILADPLPC